MAEIVRFVDVAVANEEDCQKALGIGFAAGFIYGLENIKPVQEALMGGSGSGRVQR